MLKRTGVDLLLGNPAIARRQHRNIETFELILESSNLPWA